MNIQTKYDTNISFKRLIPLKKQPYNAYAISVLADRLNIQTRELYKYTREMNVKQYDFFNSLVNKYNNIYKNNPDKENIEILFNIVKKIEAPSRVHYDLLENFQSSFANFLKIIQVVKNKKDLKTIAKREKNLSGNKTEAENFVSDIINSPNKSTFIKTLQKTIHENIQKKSKQISPNQKQKDLEELYDNFFVGLTLSKYNLDKYYTPEGADFIKNFANIFHLNPNITKIDDANIVEIYKSCTDKNIDLRKKLIGKYHDSIYKTNNLNEEISALNSLFKKIDNEKTAFIFISKYISKDTNIETISALNDILNTITTHQALIFHKNLHKILSATKPGAERNTILKKEIFNAFYQNNAKHQKKAEQKVKFILGYITTGSKIDKILKTIENIFNIAVYKLQTEIKKHIQHPAQAVQMNKKYYTSFILPDSGRELIEKDSNNIELNLSDNIKMNPKKKQEQELQNNVKTFISKKLHHNTYEEQKNIYLNKATKLRFKLLSEIFESIKETRKTDKAAGKTKSYSANIDAVDLYTRINGNNKQLVNYMLKKRNIDGTRMFEVQDIISALDKAHKKIILSRLKPSETKSYYKHLYDAKVQQYGKL